MDLIAEVWQRARATDPPLSEATVLLIGFLALGLVMFAWPAVRQLITVGHEGGHALVAVLSGRRLSGIRLHSDTSGLTLTRGRPRGPGMVATLFAGYPAASLLGLGAAALAGSGHSAGLLWLAVGLLALMLVKIRNLYGLAVVLGTGAAVALASWYAPPEWLAWFAFAIAWLLLLAGPRPVLETVLHRSHRQAPHSDAAQLARLTKVPRMVWSVLWLVMTGGSLLRGASWLLPGLAAG